MTMMEVIMKKTFFIIESISSGGGFSLIYLHFGGSTLIPDEQEMAGVVDADLFLEPPALRTLLLHVGAGEVAVDQRGLSRAQGSHDAQPEIGHAPRQGPFLTVHERVWKIIQQKSKSKQSSSNPYKGPNGGRRKKKSDLSRLIKRLYGLERNKMTSCHCFILYCVYRNICYTFSPLNKHLQNTLDDGTKRECAFELFTKCVVGKDYLSSK